MSLHSNLKRDVIRRYWFDSFAYAKWKINDYMVHYNNRRRHRSLKKPSPVDYWAMMFPDFPIRPQTASSGENVKGVDSTRKSTTIDTGALDNFGTEATFTRCGQYGSRLSKTR
jgi:Integrase core domain